MFRIRIHSVDFPRPEEGSSRLTSTHHQLSPEAEPASAAGDPLDAAGTSGASASIASRNPNPNIQLIRGVVHLYRSSTAPSSSTASSSSNPQPLADTLLPPWRGTRLLVLAVPSFLSSEDFVRFCGSYVERALEIRVIRNDWMEDKYSVLVEFDDQKSADGFYLDLNGWRFSSSEGEVCHVLFLVSVEYTQSMEIAATPPVGFIELPICPVCIERLDQDISGIVATTCDHSFQCSCISKWVNSSCPVCQFCQKHSNKPTCSICETSENLWICLICGFVGCGRYKEGHAIRHWKDTQHCYSLDLETQRVWDYVGDSYVHRLNQSKSDEKLVKLRSKCKFVGDNCISCTCNEDFGITGAILSSKVEAIVDEYNRLLASQLETQRQYYEALLIGAKEEREKHISEAVDKALNIKLHDIQLKLENLSKEKKKVAEMNDNLMRAQIIWCEKLKEIEKREQSTLKMKDETIYDLEEQIRDFTVCIEAQKTIGKMADADDIREGMLLPVPSLPAPAAKSKRSAKMNKRRS